MEAISWDKAELQVFDKLVLQCVHFVHNILYVHDFMSVDSYLIPMCGLCRYNMKEYESFYAWDFWELYICLHSYRSEETWKQLKKHEAVNFFLNGCITD